MIVSALDKSRESTLPQSTLGIPLNRRLDQSYLSVDVDMQIFRGYNVVKLPDLFGISGYFQLHSALHFQRGLTDPYGKSKSRDTQLVRDCNNNYLLFIGTVLGFQVFGEFSTEEARSLAKKKACELVTGMTAGFIEISAKRNYLLESKNQIEVSALHYCLRASGFVTVTIGLHGQKCPYYSCITEIKTIEKNCRAGPNKVSMDLALRVIPDSKGVPVVYSCKKANCVKSIFGRRSIALTSSEGTGKPASFGTYQTRGSIKTFIYSSMFHALTHRKNISSDVLHQYFGGGFYLI